MENRVIKEQEENKVIEAIRILYTKHKGRLGVERMTKQLRIEKNIYCNHKKNI